MNIYAISGICVFLVIFGVMLLVLALLFKKEFAVQGGNGDKTANRIVIITAIIGAICLATSLIIGSLFTNLTKDGGGDREMGKCWICGEKGSFQLDGSYYCYKHYNDRLSGKIG